MADLRPHGESNAASSGHHPTDVGNVNQSMGDNRRNEPPAARTKRALTEQRSVCPDFVASLKDERPEADSDSIYYGTFLEQAAEENADTFKAAAPSRLLAGPCPLRWGSCCSGSEGCHFVFQAINRVLEKNDSACSFSQAFACEKSLDKRKFIRQVMQTDLPREESNSDSASEAETGPPVSKRAKSSASQIEQGDDWQGFPCIFSDIQEMGEKVATCWQHGTKCQVPTVDFLVLGTSCKDLSKANPKQDKAALTKAATKGQSAQTFRGFLDAWIAHWLSQFVWDFFLPFQLFLGGIWQNVGGRRLEGICGCPPTADDPLRKC